MRYAVLFYADEQAMMESMGSPGGVDEHVSAFASWSRDVGERLTGGAPLAPSPTATTVRVRNGDIITTDGPFAETKEVLAGFQVLEADDLDEAIEIAARNPIAGSGAVELRPIAEEIAEAMAKALSASA